MTSTPHEQPAKRTRQSVILRREIQLIQAALMAYETTPSFTSPVTEVKTLTCTSLIPGPESPASETRTRSRGKRAKKNQDGAPAATDRSRTNSHT